MMKPSHATTYVSKIYDVNKSFLCRLRRMRADDMSVPNMDMELFNWSLESESNLHISSLCSYCLTDTDGFTIRNLRVKERGI